MDAFFHMQQGKHLLDRKDPSSLKKGLEHFKKANQISKPENIEKPIILYYLALGNLFIGNIEMSFKIANKALRSIDIAIENSPFISDNMRQILGEEGIDSLIDHIFEHYPVIVINTDPDEDDFDENHLDFTFLYNNFNIVDETDEAIPQFSFDSIKDELVMATFAALSRTEDNLVYFDKIKGDVLSYVQGYLSSNLGDQSISNRILADKITNDAPTDFIDEERYVLIGRLTLSECLKAFKSQSQSQEPFFSFSDDFVVEILKDYTYNPRITSNDILFNLYVQEKFHELFAAKYQDNLAELQSQYISIFEKSSKFVAMSWIENKIFKSNWDK